MRNVAMAIGLLMLLAGCSRQKCTRDRDCPPLSVCYRHLCAVGALDNSPCATEDDCGGNETAAMRTHTCSGGLCTKILPPPPPVDSGIPPDSGELDASDSGMALPDAGRRDAGPPPDSGPPVDSGPDLRSGTFDPSQVYLFGTVAEGSCGRDAIAAINTPNVPYLGFDCYVDEQSAKIRPTDGVVFYKHSLEDQLRAYTCESPCPYLGVNLPPYPDAPTNNDPIIPTPPCDLTNRLSQFLISPDGDIIHSCARASGTWFDANGSQIADLQVLDGSLIAYGSLGKGYTSENRVFDLVTGTSSAVRGIASTESVQTVRSLPGGEFFVGTGPAGQLYRVDSSGTANLMGTFPAAPSPYQIHDWGAKLDSEGRLYVTGLDPGAGPLTDIITRRSVSGAFELLYTEATNPAVKIHISSLFTGP